jgi:DNA polymerase-3 subunit delta'
MSWQSIEGHDGVIESFRQAVRRGRLGHAYLLVGPNGVGKRRFAQVVAQTLLCENRTEAKFEPCGACGSCAQVLAGTHPDLIQLGRQNEEHELSIEAVRQVIHDLGFKPAGGRSKVAIVNDADDMNQESANCFLKCLEEPPPQSLIFLVGTSPDLQLATIRSRCQVIRFQPLADDVVARILLHTGVVDDAAHAQRLAAMSGGSLERARGLSEPELWAFRENLARTLASRRVDTLRLGEEMNALIEAAGKESAEKRARARLLFGMATELFHGSLRRNVGARTPGHADDVQPSLDAIASHRSPEAIANSIEVCLEAEYRIDRMANVQLVVEAWIDQMAMQAG